MRFYLLDSVRLLALQCEVLSGASKKHKKFLKWCQEQLLTGIMWKILESAHSQVMLGYILRDLKIVVLYFQLQRESYIILSFEI